MTGTSVRWLRLFVGGVVGSLLLSACAGGGSTGNNGGSPKTGGTLTVGMWQEPASLLAAGITDSMTYAYALDNPVMEGLLKGRAVSDVPKNPKLADYWEPQLATEVPTAENGDVKQNSDGTMTVTYKLRHGVKWHDGVPFTSKDVKATFDLFWLKYKDKNPTALLSTSGWDQVTAVDTPDDYTATVHFAKVFGPYLLLGNGPYGILPEHLLSQVWAKSGDITKEKLTVNIPGGYSGTDTMDKFMVGTGPFMFKDWVSGDHVTLVKNPNWWGKGNGHGPYLDKIVVKWEPDTNTQLAELRTNTIDYGVDFRAALLSPLARLSSTVTTVTLPDSGAEHIDINLHNQYLSDPVLRKAILMGIDRQKIIDTLLEGKTTLTPDSWLCVGTGQWCQDPNAPHTNFDPNGAKKLLENAGYKMQSSGACSGYYANPKGQCVALHLGTTSGNALREEQEVVIQNDLKAVGIQIVTPFANFKAGKFFGSFQDGGILYTHNFDLGMYTNTYSGPAEPDSFYAGYVSTQIPSDANGGQGQNSTFCNDPKLDDAFNRGRASVKLDERKQAYIDAQKILANTLCDIPLYQQLTVLAYNKKLQGFKGNDFFWMNNAEDWYLSS